MLPTKSGALFRLRCRLVDDDWRCIFLRAVDPLDALELLDVLRAHRSEQLFELLQFLIRNIGKRTFHRLRLLRQQTHASIQINRRLLLANTADGFLAMDGEVLSQPSQHELLQPRSCAFRSTRTWPLMSRLE